MITKVTSENRGLYKALFERANADLYNGEPTIDSLNGYFSVFKSLVDLNNVYKVLPLDEPTFDINANTRVIAVPDVFKKNGVSVQGDQISEILYFTIDRYFDTTDLFDPVTAENPDGVHVVIQWEAAPNTSSGKAVSKKGISPAILVDADILSSEGKLLIGWALNNTITENAGTIKFSVRFYRIKNNQMTFSLSTLTTTASISPSLDFAFDGANSIEAIYDDSALVQNRYTNSRYVGVDKIDPPTFVVNLVQHDEDGVECIDHIYVKDADGNGTDEIAYHIVDLKDGKYTFKAQAAPKKEGIITYEWRYLPLNSPEGSSSIALTAEDIYDECFDDYYSGSKVYYHQEMVNGVPAYKTFLFKPNEETHPDGAEDVKIYEKFSGYTAIKTGDYYVNAVVHAKNSLASAVTKSMVVRIPGPAELEVTVPQGQENTLLDENGKATLYATGTTSQSKDKISYTWNKDGSSYDSIVDKENGVSTPAKTISVKDADRKLYDATYTVSVIASRNGDNTTPIMKTFRVTDKAYAPIITLDKESLDIKKGSGAKAITATIDVTGILSDRVSYQWYKVNIIDEDETAENNDPSNDTAIGSPVTVEKTAYSKNKVVATTDIQEGGKYYCVVTNEVNNDTNSIASQPIRVSEV